MRACCASSARGRTGGWGRLRVERVKAREEPGAQAVQPRTLHTHGCHAHVLPLPVLCSVGVELSRVEVRFQNLTATAHVEVGSRGMPTVTSFYRHIVEVGQGDTAHVEWPKQRLC